ncbi:hypothetical protein Rhe02_01920 [Rhizocola hellebori]|uniref:Uncharacterized protein n=1 Tax=Rhizocola hellebori TaxID=1392758 RepID=A0A8J3VCV0_9ACTN|nr:hypothetical protein [Rhizocola hellebori]GIH02125.1 hypothetical protein Rhe02_01920 [Rhizocola hellebori]
MWAWLLSLAGFARRFMGRGIANRPSPAVRLGGVAPQPDPPDWPSVFPRPATESDDIYPAALTDPRWSDLSRPRALPASPRAANTNGGSQWITPRRLGSTPIRDGAERMPPQAAPVAAPTLPHASPGANQTSPGPTAGADHISPQVTPGADPTSAHSTPGADHASPQTTPGADDASPHVERRAHQTSPHVMPETSPQAGHGDQNSLHAGPRGQQAEWQATPGADQITPQALPGLHQTSPQAGSGTHQSPLHAVPETSPPAELGTDRAWPEPQASFGDSGWRLRDGWTTRVSPRRDEPAAEGGGRAAPAEAAHSQADDRPRHELAAMPGVVGIWPSLPWHDSPGSAAAGGERRTQLTAERLPPGGWTKTSPGNLTDSAQWPQLLDDSELWIAPAAAADERRVRRLDREQEGRPWSA